MDIQEIKAPEGYKVSSVYEDGAAKVCVAVFTKEDERYIPKVGDCVKRRIASGYVYGVLNDKYDLDYCAVIPDNDGYYIEKSWSCVNLAINTKISPEELQAEFNKLGYEYDFETNTARKLRWKPKEGEKYYLMYADGHISSFHNTFGSIDNALISLGNCFKTEEEAEKFRDYIKNYNP